MRAPGDRRRIWVGLSIASLIWSGAVMGEAPAWRWRANGEAALKHNSNLTLTDGRDSEALSAALVELNGGAKGTGTVRGWRLDTQLSGLGNVHADHGEEDWFFARGRGGLRRAAGSGAVELSTEARYYTVPDQDTFDFLRNVAQAAYLLSLGEKWQARAGYANVLARYTQSPEFDYAVHGALFELRRRWSYDLNAYAQLDVQSYTGTSTPREVQGSPRDGQRYGVRLGLDGLFCGRHSLSVTYSFQSDEADLGVKQIGDPEIPENTQDIEAVSTRAVGGVEVNGRDYVLADVGSAGLLADDHAAAQQVLDAAITDIANARARIGGFQSNTVASRISAFSTAIENITAAEAVVRGADFALETAALARSSALRSASLLALADANESQSLVLDLLS